jgi:hypothetical protein
MSPPNRDERRRGRHWRAGDAASLPLLSEIVSVGRCAAGLFNRDVVKTIAKLKDGEGQYIWRESMRVGEPPCCSGFPSW